MSSSYSVHVPSEYGYVILGCVLVPAFTNIFMGGPVMKARKEMNVPYPNLYATPGYHKRADDFNRVQRGHQNFFEVIGDFRSMALIGGLKHPITCALAGVVFSLGSILYQKGYADTTLDVKTARYKKGGVVKWIGYFAAFGSCISIASSLLGWKK